MLNQHSKIGVVILAAGDGTRMKTGIPKVMNVLHGAPLVGHVVESVERSGVCEKPVVIVGANHTMVQDYLGERGAYVVQEKQLGTGHATAMAESELKGKAERVIVLYGDLPFVSGASIRRLAEEQQKSGATLTLLSAVISDGVSWHKTFSDFGRIIRDEQGQIVKSVEMRDASPGEQAVREINVGGYCFVGVWLWEQLKQLKTNNVQQEYYLNDLVRLAIEQGKMVASIMIDPKEAVGINSKEQLELAERL